MSPGAADVATAPVGAAPLGHSAALAADPLTEAAVVASRRRRWTLRHRGRSWQGKSAGSCGKHALTVQLSFARRGDRWGLSGSMHCGRVWVCPVCAARVGQRRGVEIAEGVRRHQGTAGTVLMITFTEAHGAVDDLGELVDVFQEARVKMRGRKEWARLKAEVGWEGDIGNWEVTWGEWNGWHPHRHHLAFVRPPREWFGGVAFLQWWRRLEDLWAESVASVSEQHRPGDGARLGVGVRVDVVGRGEGENAAGYLVKDLALGAAQEIARPDGKRARAGRLSPWEVLEGAVDGDKRAGRLWCEYVAVTRGRHRVQWSRGLRERLGIEVRSDEQLANDEGDADESEDLDDDETALLLACDEITPYVAEAAERGGADGLHAFLAMLLATLTSLERASLRLWARDRVGMAGKFCKVKRQAWDRAPPGDGGTLWASGPGDGPGKPPQAMSVVSRRAVRGTAQAN